MPRFAANLSMMFNELPFLDRFAAAAEAGFTAVEYLFPYEFAPDDIARRLADHRLTQALFNMPPGDWAGGDRGTACIPARAGEFSEGIATALTYAKATGVKRLHMMSGMGDRNDPAQAARYADAIREAAEKVGAEGIDLVIEPINGRDMPGFFLNDFAYAEKLIGSLGLPNLKLQFDIYHRQILHGDVTKALAAMFPIIGHVQTASVPMRHEPGTGELDDGFVFATLDRLGYQGFVGCEYRPRAGTTAGLGWFAPYRSSR
jgi:hydroxypyruvate isomerase